MTAVLDIQGVTKAYGERAVLRGIDLQVPEHAAAALIGASGSGKSTLLRCIDLLEEIDDGDIFLDGKVITDPGVDPVGVRRRLGMVFQAFTCSPPDRAGERRARARARARRRARRRRGAGARVARPLRAGRARAGASGPAFRRPAAAGREPGRFFTEPERPETQRFLRRLLEAGRLQHDPTKKHARFVAPFRLDDPR